MEIDLPPLLAALLDGGPTSASRLAARLERRKSSVLRELHGFEQHEHGALVAYRSRTWHLTPLGRRAVLGDTCSASEPNGFSSGASSGLRAGSEPMGSPLEAHPLDSGTDARAVGTDSFRELPAAAAILDRYRGNGELRDYLAEMERRGIGLSEAGEVYSGQGAVSLPPRVSAALRLLANAEVVGLAFGRSVAPPLSPAERVRLLSLWSERELFDQSEQEHFERRRRFHTMKGRSRWDASISAIAEIVGSRRRNDPLLSTAP